MNEEIPIYVPHSGTLRISGSTIPRKAASCAFHWLQEGVPIIDFFCIGANSNQQAAKALGIFFYLVEQETKMFCSVAFQPLRFRTETTDFDKRKTVKDATVWRTIIITANNTENEQQSNTPDTKE